ncbi:helix-turn-helix domain-containing protein [Streptomyces bambusae]|uniref:helix-turn-helix domain-containing protein n=1 Tax=Streptomyces bambusae TaxID=1550616 RepID=UPI001CFC841B|nr:helix-turn-helix transcriptional regulator [Streptomyces bambusae]MCB5166782.1 helix-turn-helix domain-containing protein [Streptomyces bambusae]
MGRGEAVGKAERAAETQEFARLMRQVKERSGLSYGVLAKRLHTGTSTLHRYCSGDAVPAEFGAVDRFARACGAGPEAALELHRAWLLADARRRSAARAGAEGGEPAAEEDGSAAGAAEPAGLARPVEAVAVAEAVVDAVSGPVDAGVRAEAGELPDVRVGPPAADVRTPWYRRGGRSAAAAAVALAVGLVLALVLAIGLPAGGGERTAGGLRSPQPLPPGPALSSGGPAAPTTEPAGAPSATPSGSPPAGSRTASPVPTPARSSAVPPPVPARPLTVGVRSHVWQAGCDHAYLIGRPPSAVPAPPVEQDAPGWARAQRAVHAERQIVEATVGGRTGQPVVLQALHVRVTGRGTPPPWNVYEMSPGCGGSLTPAVFSVNLDAPRPLARPVAGHDGEHDLPAPSFPLKVSEREPAVLRVEAAASGCDCSWYLELQWTAGGRSGTTRIDDGGRPFRTSAVAGRPVYGYAAESGRWATG